MDDKRNKWRAGKLSELEWRGLLGKYEKSGMSQEAFSRANGLSYGTFQKRLKKWRLEKADSGQFIDLSGSDKIELIFGNGVKLSIPVSCEAEKLLSIIEGLGCLK